jgi:hypothetical protein
LVSFLRRRGPVCITSELEAGREAVAQLQGSQQATPLGLRSSPKWEASARRLVVALLASGSLVRPTPSKAHQHLTTSHCPAPDCILPEMFHQLVVSCRSPSPRSRLIPIFLHEMMAIKRIYENAFSTRRKASAAQADHSFTLTRALPVGGRPCAVVGCLGQI